MLHYLRVTCFYTNSVKHCQCGIHRWVTRDKGKYAWWESRTEARLALRSEAHTRQKEYSWYSSWDVPILGANVKNCYFTRVSAHDGACRDTAGVWAYKNDICRCFNVQHIPPVCVGPNAGYESRRDIGLIFQVSSPNLIVKRFRS